MKPSKGDISTLENGDIIILHLHLTLEHFTLGLWMCILSPFLKKKEKTLIQVGVLSSSEAAELLKTNPDQFPDVYDGMVLKTKDLALSKSEYVVLRFKSTSSSRFGDVKCYFSCFPYSITQPISVPGNSTYADHINVILPYPEFSNVEPQKPCSIAVKWKNFFENLNFFFFELNPMSSTFSITKCLFLLFFLVSCTPKAIPPKTSSWYHYDPKTRTETWTLTSEKQLSGSVIRLR